ncbi:hypothetical protein O2W18_10260 [Modestobacter sp. VKM Ac-2983]|uniref:hypothetical protein n=1 Tax=Modestobacter sp. VKM Ac-2983 TaxID=3004137 RepID=UPI0022AB8204|nr:hypothetical protein [Modestobacter sp. VKM Ac-2983]MCZ2805486.1 hypothetical protein [Modestobacter sp. VKM Ac-2983]
MSGPDRASALNLIGPADTPICELGGIGFTRLGCHARETERVAAVEGMVEMDIAVWTSALGSSLKTQIAGHHVELRLPRPPRTAEGIGLLGGELTAPAFEYIEEAEKLRSWMHDTSPAWGKCNMRDPAGGDAAAVRRCALVVSVADDLAVSGRQDVADAIFQTVHQWRSVVADWLQIAFRQALDAVGPVRPGTAIQPWMWSHDGQKRVPHYGDRTLVVFDHHGEPVDAATLQRVLDLAADLIRPPLAWRLIRDAQRRLTAGEDRRAVLDAGTAAEIALYEALPLHGVPPAKKETLGTLVGKASTVSALNISNAQADLVDVRNDAAHRATPPGGAKAALALEISASYVESAWPRAALLPSASTT